MSQVVVSAPSACCSYQPMYSFVPMTSRALPSGSSMIFVVPPPGFFWVRTRRAAVARRGVSGWGGGSAIVVGVLVGAFGVGGLLACDARVVEGLFRLRRSRLEGC